MYGPAYNDIRRYWQHNLCYNPARLQARVNGAAAEAWFMLVPMPKREERWIWFDNFAYIRGIYLPAAQTTDEQYKDLCTYICVNFTRRPADQQMWNIVASRFETFPCDKLFGLGCTAKKTIGIDVSGLHFLLGLPRQLRKENAYTAHLVCFAPIESVTDKNGKTGPFPLDGQLFDGNDFDWNTITKASTGLELQWKPFIPTPTDNWMGNTLKNLIMYGLGFVPEVGLIAQVAFSLLWTGLTDFDSFFATLLEVIPPLQGLSPAINKQSRADTTEMKKFQPAGWDKAGSPLQKKLTQTIPGSGIVTGVDPHAPQTNPDGTPEAVIFMKGQKVIDKSPNLQPPDNPPTEDLV